MGETAAETDQDQAGQLAAMRAELEALRLRAEHNEQAVKELRDSQELTRRLIEAMPGGVVHVGADGAIQTANAEAQRILGLSYDDLTHKYVVDFETQTVFEDGSPCTAEDYPVTLAIVTGEAQPPCTIGVTRPDGAVSWAVFTAVPIKDETGSTRGAVVTFIDITKRKQLEQELREAQKMEAIGRLAGGIAHDFNNLLTVIVGNTSDVRHGLSEQETARDDLDQVLQAAKHATSLTSQLLAFARRQPAAATLLALDVLLEETASLLRRLIGEHIELVIENPPKLWPVRVDPSQFQQIIVNLALNARDAMTAGGRLTLATENARRPGEPDEVVLRVRDTGTGIDPTILPHVFEPFFTTKGGHRGTGLGLATCYGIAKQAGGTIKVSSVLGQGTTFEVRIPRAPEDMPPETAVGPVVVESGGTETLLVVEDEPAVLRVLERGLRRLGYRVLTACGGPEALEILERDPHVQLLVTDVVMPGMTGLELARQTRRSRPELPVVFMSGYPDSALNEQGFREGDFAYLRKPFQSGELATSIRTLLDRSGLLQRDPVGGAGG